MAKRFAYEGHARVGAFVAGRLKAAGWVQVDDAAEADVVVTYFTYATGLEDAYFETDGLIKRAHAQALLVDLSPASPSFSRELAAVATVNDLRFIEAPIVVCDPTAADAFAPDNVMCLLAGDEAEIVDAGAEVADMLAATVRRVGVAGRAQLARCAYTSQIAAQVLTAVESSSLYHVFDEPAETIPALDGLGLVSAVLAAIAEGRFTGAYTVEMMMGDVVAAITSAGDADLILPQLETIMHLLELLAVIGGADLSPAALALLYREEQASADAGLDWTRAEGLFDGGGHDHDHGGDFGSLGGYEDYDDDAPFGLAGGFGGYSAN